MADPTRPHAADLQAAILRVHAEDVERARRLVDDCVQASDTAWIPRNALLEALVGALRDLTRPPVTPRADA